MIAKLAKEDEHFVPAKWVQKAIEDIDDDKGVRVHFVLAAKCCSKLWDEHLMYVVIYNVLFPELVLRFCLHTACKVIHNDTTSWPP